jgi:hypothetical protein
MSGYSLRIGLSMKRTLRFSGAPSDRSTDEEAMIKSRNWNQAVVGLHNGMMMASTVNRSSILWPFYCFAISVDRGLYLFSRSMAWLVAFPFSLFLWCGLDRVCVGVQSVQFQGGLYNFHVRQGSKG